MGDATAGTVVICTKNKSTLSHTILEELDTTYVPTFTNVTLLTDKDVCLIKETFYIAKKSNYFRTLNALRDKVESILKTTSE